MTAERGTAERVARARRFRGGARVEPRRTLTPPARRPATALLLLLLAAAAAPPFARATTPYVLTSAPANFTLAGPAWVTGTAARSAEVAAALAAAFAPVPSATVLQCALLSFGASDTAPFPAYARARAFEPLPQSRGPRARPP